MYSTCIFCSADLGSNEAIEHFRVGRRLAFDSARGRLWAVCRRCRRWNLTPIEERWEAIEEAERLFSATRMRASTDNIGLARVKEGLELVRIGRALRPELAAWRYGDHFGRRWRRHNAMIVAGFGGATLISLASNVPSMLKAVGVASAAGAAGVTAGGALVALQATQALLHFYSVRRTRVALRDPQTKALIRLRSRRLEDLAIVRTEDGGWGVRLAKPRRKPRGTRRAAEMYPEETQLLITGADALPAAAKLLPAVNMAGGEAKDVQSAVEVVTSMPDPALLFLKHASVANEKVAMSSGRGEVYRTKTLMTLPNDVRLALEMASHEDQERRAMEGELALLEAAWRDAEEIGKIADDLLLPEHAAARLGQLKRED